jgi:hypothetical protein
MAQLTQAIIEAAIDGFEAQKKNIDAQIATLRAMLPGAEAATPKPGVSNKRGRRGAGRKAAAEPQEERSAASKPAKKGKRKLSAAGRANIVAALKKRWAEKKANSAKESGAKKSAKAA